MCRLALTSVVSLRRRSHRRSLTEWSFLYKLLQSKPLYRCIWVFPKIGVPPKWMVYNGKPYYIKWMIWGYPYFWKHPYHIYFFHIFSSSTSMISLACHPFLEKFEFLVGDSLIDLKTHSVFLCGLLKEGSSSKKCTQES